MPMQAYFTCLVCECDLKSVISLRAHCKGMQHIRKGRTDNCFLFSSVLRIWSRQFRIISLSGVGAASNCKFFLVLHYTGRKGRKGARGASFSFYPGARAAMLVFTIQILFTKVSDVWLKRKPLLSFSQKAKKKRKFAKTFAFAKILCSRDLFCEKFPFSRKISRKIFKLR
jgi:hypothetical protein